MQGHEHKWTMREVGNLNDTGSGTLCCMLNGSAKSVTSPLLVYCLLPSPEQTNNTKQKIPLPTEWAAGGDSMLLLKEP